MTTITRCCRSAPPSILEARAALRLKRFTAGTHGVPDPGELMAEPVPTGSDVSAGTYKCTNCDQTIDAGSIASLPPCPSCSNTEWETVTGGDSVDDPYPDKS